MASNSTSDKDGNGPGASNNTSEVPSSSPAEPSSSPPIQPFRHKSNAPNSPYPPPSNHEYPPRTPSTSSDGSSSSSAKHDPTAPILPLPYFATLRGRPTPPSLARPPNQNDERCIIYCTQTASRRSVGQQPICKTFCWRRLYPQDYTPANPSQQWPQEGAAQDATQTSTTKAIGKEGNVIKMPDGRTVVERKTFMTKPGIFGFDGRFVYFGRSRFRAKDRLDSMSHPGLSEDWHVDEILKDDDPRKADKAYVDFLRRYHYSTQVEVSPLPNQLYDAIAEKFASLMKPATKYIDSFAPGGAQERFALKVWEKAKTGDGWVLFTNAANTMWEQAKKSEAEERSKKNGGNGNGKAGGAGGGSVPPAASPPPAASA